MHSVGRWTSQIVTAVIRYRSAGVAPASESGSPPMTLLARGAERGSERADLPALVAGVRRFALASVSG